MSSLLFTLQLSVGFSDFAGMQSLKCGNSNKSRPGLEDYCCCVYQSIIFLAVFYYIRYEPFFHFHSESNQYIECVNSWNWDD